MSNDSFYEAAGEVLFGIKKEPAMPDDRNMRERLQARASDRLSYWLAHFGASQTGTVERKIAADLADAILDELREPENDILAAGYEAMFEDKWDGSQAPMMAAGWQAMIDAAKQGRG